MAENSFGEFIGGFATGGILNVVIGLVAGAVLGNLIVRSAKA